MTTPAPLPPPFLPLSSPEASLETVGGKGINLVRLSRAGFSVPDGFLIPTGIYQDFVDANQLEVVIRNELADLDFNDPDQLDTAARKIREAFEAGAFPPGIHGLLDIAYHWLSLSPVAVRSSATAEDLPEMSFAGQQDTYLNIINLPALEQAVKACWGSLWTARAIGYRARNEVDPHNVRLAVVVQKMIQAEASGVLFTANPLTGNRYETVIDATLGLGEALVSGQVQPDHYVVSRAQNPSTHEHSLAVTTKSLGEKATVIRGDNGGGTYTDQGPHTSGYAQTQALPDPAILELARLGQRVQAVFQFPQDIEWAYSGGELFLLQSRSITSLFPLPEGMPPDPLRVMIGFHTIQGIMEPITPLGRDVLMMVLTGAGRALGYHLRYDQQTAFYTAAERLWIDQGPLLKNTIGQKFLPEVISSIDPGVAQAFRTLLRDPRLAPKRKGIRPKTVLRLARFLLPTLWRVLKIWRRTDQERDRILAAMDARVIQARSQLTSTGDLWGDFKNRLAMLHTAENIFPDMVIPQGVTAVISGMAPFFGILQRFSQQTSDPQLYLELSRGLPFNVTTEMDLSLWEIAQALQGDAPSKQIFEQNNADELADRFLGKNLPPVARQSIETFMEKYGMRGFGEIDIGRPRWREKPAQVMKILQSYLQITDPNQAPDVVFERGAEAAKAAAKKLIAAVRQLPGGLLKADLVRWAITRYRAIAGLREAPKFFAIRMMGIIRQGFLASGQSLVDAGLLEKPDDLFYLKIHELDRISASQTIPAELRNRISTRRATRVREMRRRQLPRVLLSDGTVFYTGVQTDDADSGVIVGDPVSPGLVEGVVHVVFDPHAAHLAPGEILVCPGTDPAWTPLFLAASGLIMEVGGMMTHGSVVAREYGIPAVVGVQDATTRLPTGTRIRLNGSSGQIEILEDQGETKQATNAG